jgi:hypothetical protein
VQDSPGTDTKGDFSNHFHQSQKSRNIEMSQTRVQGVPYGAIVITTISMPTKAVIEWAAIARKLGWMVVCVGDKKTPAGWECEGVDFLSIDMQRQLYGELSDHFPFNHYCRKNLGYLYAIEKGVDYILDTDDDNYPIPGFFESQLQRWSGEQLVDIVGSSRWVNVYGWFGRPDLWPRGNPLSANASYGHHLSSGAARNVSVVQFLVNGDPDIDAVQRLLGEKPFVNFTPRARPIGLASESWCAFNSQATLFSREAFPLLYLPCDVSFRMTDIWRSFVALAVLKRQERVVAFDEPIAYQLRNAHNLLKDFQDEVVGYVHNDRIIEALSEVATITEEPEDTIKLAIRSYEILCSIGITPASEIHRHAEFIRRLGA